MASGKKPPDGREGAAPTFRFPDPERGLGEHGLLFLGENYEPAFLLAAYRRGIFPWPAPDQGLVLWCSPHPRAVRLLDAATEPSLHWSRSLRRTLRQRRRFRITVDRAFGDVVAGCADREEGTWITPGYLRGFAALHRQGHAHSLEVWDTGTNDLVGGIYGLAIGAAFCAESMFHRRRDASKVAFARLTESLRSAGFHFLDAQVPTDHLESMGCVAMPRAQFLARLARAVATPAVFPSDPK